MTTDIAVRDERDSWVEVINPVSDLAKYVATTEFVPRGLQGRPAAIAAAILTGRELGVGPMRALAIINIIEGRPTLSAEGMVALIRRAGHQARPVRSTLEIATVKGRRVEDRDDPDGWVEASFSRQDAERAGLWGKRSKSSGAPTPWVTYPAEMLLARAWTRLARMLFSDVINGLQTESEAEDLADGEGGPEPVTTVRPPARLARQGRARESRGAAKVPPAAAPVADIVDAELVDAETGEVVPAPAAEPPEPEAEPARRPERARQPRGGDAPAQPPADPGPPPMSPEQRGLLWQLLKETGQDADDDRHRYATACLGRTVDTYVGLTMTEAAKLVTSLQADLRALAADDGPVEEDQP
jgi:hypothetical protein